MSEMVGSNRSPDAESSERQAEHARIFREHRRLLFGIAYRMLGSVMDAEDVLQDAYLNWSAVDLAEIESPPAYLRTIVSRRCLDQLKSARVRRESYVGPWLPEPLRHDHESAGEPADWTAALPDDRPDAAAEYERGEILRESLSIAFLILLESLSPVERAVYLLREVFAVDFAEIAGVVEKSAENCRQILHRARDGVQRRRKRDAAPDSDRAAQLLEKFLQAMNSGDLPAFTALLAEDVRYHSDGGGVVQAALNIIQGADSVARFQLGVLKFLPEDVRLEPAVLNGTPGLVVYTADGQAYATLGADFAADGRVQNIYSVRNPEKLRHLAKFSE